MKAIAGFLAIALSITTSHASMISTETFIAESFEAEQRERLHSLLQRADVRDALIKNGLDPAEAAARVLSLTETELRDLSARIDELPAGKDAAGAIIGAVLAVFFVLLITDILCFTKVFPFTRCATGTHR